MTCVFLLHSMGARLLVHFTEGSGMTKPKALFEGFCNNRLTRQCPAQVPVPLQKLPTTYMRVADTTALLSMSWRRLQHAELCSREGLILRPEEREGRPPRERQTKTRNKKQQDHFFSICAAEASTEAAGLAEMGH